MDAEKTQVVQACARDALSGAASFPEIVGRLMAIEGERYHVDYSRQEITYYLADGDSQVVASPHEAWPIASKFSASAVAEAVRQSQAGEHTYIDFVRKTMAAGCVGYFVQIRGRQVLYFGRDGDCHVERFPSAD